MDFITPQLKSFIGQGITLPLKLVNGRPLIESGFDLIRSSIITILTWQEGNRFFLNEFGSKLEKILEEPNDQTLQEVIEVFIIDAINRWEKRVVMEYTTIERRDEKSINITVTYRMINQNMTDTFVFPFYTKIIY